ncbi:MAG: KGK domain-containing protein [Microcoleaceae cyanobacterium]
MTDRVKLENCENDDILSFDDEICKVKKIKQASNDYCHHISDNYVDYIGENVNIRGLNILHDFDRRFKANYEWFDSGKECELLKEGKRWQKGKLRIKLTLEFIPDEPVEENDYQEIESPLDEIRQQLTENNKVRQ